MYVEIPRPRRYTPQTWTMEEINQFLHYAKINKPVYYMCFMTAIHTGMRRGEVLGLRWQDIDFENKKINVIQSLIYDDEGLRFGDLKTLSSKRHFHR